MPEGTITEAGVRANLRVAIQYLASWFRGNGCLPIDDHMEDAATAEIARAQVWQWVRYPAGRLEDGRDLSFELALDWLMEEAGRLRARLGNQTWNHGHYAAATKLFRTLIEKDDFVSFLTLPAYPLLD